MSTLALPKLSWVTEFEGDRSILVVHAGPLTIKPYALEKLRAISQPRTAEDIVPTAK